MSDAAECIFCKIVSGELSCQKVYEDDKVLGILDIYPFAKGHCQIIPKRHVQWFYDMEDEEIAHLARVAKLVANKIKKAFNPDFVCGFVRGKRIPHVHIILFPIFEGDMLDRFFGALDLVQLFPGEIAKLAPGSVARKIRDA